MHFPLLFMITLSVVMFIICIIVWYSKLKTDDKAIIIIIFTCVYSFAVINNELKQTEVT